VFGVGVCSSITMALIPRFAFLSLLLLPLYRCEAAAENCSETQCLLLPDGVDQVASEFRLKSSEKGVRLVHINLVIGNASYDPLELPDVFLPHRWIWANTIYEPMLSLPDDYDILSAGLLNYQVRSMHVKLKDQPSGCLAKLNSTCQNLAVGRMLLENVTSSISGDLLHKKTPVVCVALINRTFGDVRYHCCDMHNEGNGPATIRCERRVDKGDLILKRVIFMFYLLMSFFVTFYIPFLPLALPNVVFSVQNEVEKETRLSKQTILETTRYRAVAEGEQDNQRETGADRSNSEDEALLPTTSGTAIPAAGASNTVTINANQEETDQNTSDCAGNSRKREEETEFIPVDDSSPVNFSTLLRECVEKLPNIPMSFNIKLAVMLLCFFPCIIYFQIVLYPTLKNMQLNECYKKRVAFKEVTIFSQFLFFVPIDEGQSRPFLIAVILILTLLALILKPNDFVIPEGKECTRCRKYSEKHDNTFRFSDHRLVGVEIRRHLKIRNRLPRIFLRNCRRKVIYGWQSVSYSCYEIWQKSRLHRVICVVLSLILIPFAAIISLVALSVIIVVLVLVETGYTIVYSPFVTTCECGMKLTCDNRFRNICPKIPRMFQICLCVCLFFIIYWVSTTSLYFVLRVLEYTMLGLTLNISILTPFVVFFLTLSINLYLCYSKMQSKCWEVKKMISERLQELQLNSNVPKDTIRADIYWFVSNKVLPVRDEIFRMLRNMVLVILFLFLALSSIVFYGNEYDISSLTTTVSVFFTGSIPQLFLKALTTNSIFTGWAKIKMERKINKAVIEYRDSRNVEAIDQQIADT